MDGGVQRGTHVIKALSLGAKAVGLGRFYLYPLAAAGYMGVEGALGLMRAEIERGMKLMGSLRSISYPATICGFEAAEHRCNCAAVLFLESRAYLGAEARVSSAGQRVCRTVLPRAQSCPGGAGLEGRRLPLQMDGSRLGRRLPRRCRARDLPNDRATDIRFPQGVFLSRVSHLCRHYFNEAIVPVSGAFLRLIKLCPGFLSYSVPARRKHARFHA